MPRNICCSEAIPYDFKIVTRNDKYIFIMLADMNFGGFDPEIRKVYKHSGLYKNDGSNKPLWTIDWYGNNVFICSDGIHLFRIWRSSSIFDQKALAFYKNGKEIKVYRINDLVRDESKLDETVSHILWLTEFDSDDDKLLLFLKTKDNQSYTFSVETGDIINNDIQPSH